MTPLQMARRAADLLRRQWVEGFEQFAEDLDAGEEFTEADLDPNNPSGAVGSLAWVSGYNWARYYDALEDNPNEVFAYWLDAQFELGEFLL